MKSPHDAAESAANSLLPLDGPYTTDSIVAAAATIAELVRRLNHATLRTGAFTYPRDIDRTVGYLRAAAAGLPQTFRQIGRDLDEWARHPGLGADDRGTSETAATVAAMASFELTSDAAHAADQLGLALNRVTDGTSRLSVTD